METITVNKKKLKAILQNRKDILSLLEYYEDKEKISLEEYIKTRNISV